MQAALPDSFCYNPDMTADLEPKTPAPKYDEIDNKTRTKSGAPIRDLFLTREEQKAVDQGRIQDPEID